MLPVLFHALGSTEVTKHINVTVRPTHRVVLQAQVDLQLASVRSRHVIVRSEHRRTSSTKDSKGITLRVAKATYSKNNKKTPALAGEFNQ